MIYRSPLLGAAVGDALGAPYEFGPAQPDLHPEMCGGGVFNWEPGEWTDDTSMALPIAHEVAGRKELWDRSTLDRINAAWYEWSRTAPDVGAHTRSVLRPTRHATLAAAQTALARYPDNSGNGAVMRTAPVAMAHPDDPKATERAARAVAGLTHPHRDAVTAAALWTEVVRTAILGDTMDALNAADMVVPKGAERRMWQRRLIQAEEQPPTYYTNKNGWSVGAVCAAWSILTRATTFEEAVTEACRAGGDTDTVAAIVGMVAAPQFGDIPTHWVNVTHGWPGITAAMLPLR